MILAPVFFFDLLSSLKPILIPENLFLFSFLSSKDLGLVPNISFWVLFHHVDVAQVPVFAPFLCVFLEMSPSYSTYCISMPASIAVLVLVYPSLSVLLIAVSFDRVYLLNDFTLSRPWYGFLSWSELWSESISPLCGKGLQSINLLYLLYSTWYINICPPGAVSQVFWKTMNSPLKCCNVTV